MARVGFVSLTLAAVLTGCGQTQGSDPLDHLDCAAYLSAEQNLVQTGALDIEPEFRNSLYLTMMWYINAHAIPQGIREDEAFAQLKSRTAEIIEQQSASQIDQIARQCIDELPDRIPQAREHDI